MPMSDTEIRLWKRRLQHAENMWRENGWIPDGKGAGQTSSDKSFALMQYLNAYRGKFAPVMNGALDPADQMVGNLTFSLVNTMVAQISAKIPDPILRPLGGAAADANARRRAWLNEQVVEMMVKEKKVKREMDRALLSSILAGAGFVRHGFTPEVEFVSEGGELITRFKNQTPDFPWVQFMRPWEMRVDPLVNAFDPDSEPRWCAFYAMHYEHQIRKNPELTFRRDLTPTKHFDTRPEAERSAVNKSVDPDAMGVYEEWVIYDADERKFFGLSPGSEKEIREAQDWPFDWGQLPYSYLAMNEQLDTPFPIAFPSMFWDEQKLYNRLWSLINALVSRMRRIIFASNGLLSSEAMAMLKNPDAFMEVIEAEGGDLTNAIQEIGIAPLDPQIIGLLYQVKEAIREILGVSSFDRGQRANVETAEEAGAIAAGGAITRGRTQERYEAFWANTIRVMHRALLQSEQARTLILPIVGRSNLDFLTADERSAGFLEVSLDDLQGEFSYDVKLDSTLRTDPNTEFARLAGAYGIMGGPESQMANQNYWHERFAELGGADPQQAIVSEQVQQQLAQNAAQAEEGAQGPGDAIPAAAVNSAAQGLRPVPGGAG